MKNEDIRKAFDSLTPSEEAKERMLRDIMAKTGADTLSEASAKPSASAPWYIRFRPQLDAVGALAACAVLVTALAVNPAFTTGGNKEAFVQETRPQTTTIVSAVTSAEAEKAAQTETTVSTAETTALTSAVTEVSASAETEKVQTTAVTSAKPVCTETAVSTQPAADTTAPTEAVTTVDSTAEATVSATVTTKSLYGDLYDFSNVSWAGISYSTDYAEIDYSRLSDNLGSGVALSNGIGLYTILIYEIAGVPVEDAIAVQYIGQTNYYYFYRVQ